MLCPAWHGNMYTTDSFILKKITATRMGSYKISWSFRPDNIFFSVFGRISSMTFLSWNTLKSLDSSEEQKKRYSYEVLSYCCIPGTYPIPSGLEANPPASFPSGVCLSNWTSTPAVCCVCAVEWGVEIQLYLQAAWHANRAIISC